MACETYDDGSYYCVDANGYWEYADAYGNTSYGTVDASQLDPNSLATTIADTLSSIFGGGQRGYYAPNRNQQPYSYPGPGPYYPNQTAVGINAGVNRQGANAGVNLSTNTLMLIGGGILLFILGTKRGR